MQSSANKWWHCQRGEHCKSWGWRGSLYHQTRLVWERMSQEGDEKTKIISGVYWKCERRRRGKRGGVNLILSNDYFAIMFFLFQVNYLNEGTAPHQPRLSMFCELSQNYQHFFWKIIQASWSKLSEKLSWLVDQEVLELLIKTIFCKFWSTTLRTTWPIRILIPFLSFSDTFASRCFYYFQHSVVIILKKHTKHVHA